MTEISTHLAGAVEGTESGGMLRSILEESSASPPLRDFRLTLMRMELDRRPGRAPALLRSAWVFEVRPDDILWIDPLARLEDNGASLVSTRGRQPVDARHRETLQRLLRAPSGRPVRDYLAAGDGLEAVQAHLGSAFELPVVAELSREVSHLELCRFPAPRYAVARPYWENSVDVRHALTALPGAVHDRDAFVGLLRELHVRYLMGSRLTSPYAPVSQTRRMLLQTTQGPGQLRQNAVNCPVTQRFAFSYFKLLARSFGDRFAATDEVSHADGDGTSWGRTGWGSRTVNGVREPIHLFHPPPRVTTAHLDRLWCSAAAAVEKRPVDDVGSRLHAVADFFRRFICLHPFVCGNMGLAMNMVNAMLQQAVGGTICHLHLDWCAHRLEPRHFARLFERVVDRYLMRPDDLDAEARVMAQFDEMRQCVLSLPAVPPGSEVALLLR